MAAAPHQKRNVSGLKKTAGPGRKKGGHNKLSVTIKTAIENAFRKVGGEDYLVMVAKEHPAVFCGLLGRIVPPPMPDGMKAGAGLFFVCPTTE